MSPSVRSSESRPACDRIQNISANITTYTAGPQKSMNLRIVSMPRWKMTSWKNHMNRKLTQPSRSSRRKLVPRSATTDGTNSTSSVATALLAK